MSVKCYLASKPSGEQFTKLGVSSRHGSPGATDSPKSARGPASIFGPPRSGSAPRIRSFRTVIPGTKRPEKALENVRLMVSAIPPELWRELKAEGLLREDAPVPL